MAGELRNRVARAGQSAAEWSAWSRTRLERLVFLITVFAFCWLMTRFFIFLLRRFRW